MDKVEEMVLAIENLKVCYGKNKDAIEAVKGIDLQIQKGRICALVGESGSGKSAVALSIAKLLDYPGRITDGKIYLHGQDLQRLSRRKLRSLLGKEIGMVFQDPFDSLNPRMKIGQMVLEALYPHKRFYTKLDREEAVLALAKMQLPYPEKLMNQYAYQLSGGMCQRVMIAIAMAQKPQLLIADEPTTALDVTVQAEILKELLELKEVHHTAILFITHDLRVVAELADDVYVMKDGEIVESCCVETLFVSPKQDYTKELLDSML